MVEDARGQYMIEVSKKTRERIVKWLSENKNATKGQACEELGITYTTLRKHLKEINKKID